MLVVSVRCGKGRDMTRGRHVDDNCLVRHNDAQSLRMSHACSRDNCDHAVQLCTCCICGCTVHKCKGFLKNLHGDCLRPMTICPTSRPNVVLIPPWSQSWKNGAQHQAKSSQGSNRDTTFSSASKKKLYCLTNPVCIDLLCEILDGV